MNKRILGRTGLKVSELALGAAFVTRGGTGFAGAVEVINAAVDAGMNLVDTSADYGDSEAGVGEALKDIDRPLIVSTKLGPRSKDFNPKSLSDLRAVFDESTRLLHRDVIDILMIHEPDRPGEIDWWDDVVKHTGPVVDFLESLKAEGKIRFTGLGGTTAYEMVPIIATGGYDVVLTAFNSSMLWREAMIELIPEAKKQRMGIMIASPTQQGWLAQRFDRELENADSLWINKPRREQLKRLYRLVDETNIPIPEMALRWALMYPDASTVLTGPRNIPQLEQNLKAMADGPLPAEVVARIDEIAAMVPFRPFEEPFGCPLFNPRFPEQKRPGRAGR